MNGTDDYGHRGRRKVTIDRDVYETLTAHAEAWRDFARQVGEADRLVALLIEAPGVRELIMQEFAAWNERKQASESASAISAVGNWNRGPSHEQLQQRRQQPGELHRQAVQRRGEYTGGPVDWITGRPLNSDDLAA